MNKILDKIAKTFGVSRGMVMILGIAVLGIGVWYLVKHAPVGPTMAPTTAANNTSVNPTTMDAASQQNMLTPPDFKIMPPSPSDVQPMPVPSAQPPTIYPPTPNFKPSTIIPYGGPVGIGTLGAGYGPLPAARG